MRCLLAFTVAVALALPIAHGQTRPDVPRPRTLQVIPLSDMKESPTGPTLLYLSDAQMRQLPPGREGAPQAGAGDLMGRLAGDVVARQHDLAAVELLEARQAVDCRALARAVGPDQAGHAAGLDRERDEIGRAHV